MHEKKFEIQGINPIELVGVNNEKLKVIQAYFSKLKIVARGNVILVKGDEDEVKRFETKFKLLLSHLDRYNELTENHIDNLMLDDGAKLLSGDGSEILVHGNSGIKVKARTYNQRELVKAVNKNDMVFAVGPAGTGKTYTAVALAVRALKAKEVRRIILTRPAVEAGENLGFLPGDMKEKLDPYMMPLYDALRDMIPAEKLADLIELGVIEIAPLAFMRGRTLDKAFVILDEAQNTTVSQMKMFLTRMGKSANFVITGDASQIDLPRKQKSGLIFALDVLKGIDGIGMIRLNQNDVIRHRIVKQIIEAFDKAEENE
ncbi:phosphate starvation-inducible protein PhoH [Lishizhenia tianjinensis]|uniref:PhoH-like protein n=1 Tax=Lishizhenia tianjinensis TaxID=477690 RepID=A0A1I7A544_9FLAO|nr:PhoH family protein [Lishizhenia tianjinensis]SFT70017.1 phosphate starvation-inducible protein PhoH [Lishizhenia tianjinensis]